MLWRGRRSTSPWVATSFVFTCPAAHGQGASCSFPFLRAEERRTERRRGGAQAGMPAAALAVKQNGALPWLYLPCRHPSLLHRTLRRRRHCRRSRRSRRRLRRRGIGSPTPLLHLHPHWLPRLPRPCPRRRRRRRRRRSIRRQCGNWKRWASLRETRRLRWLRITGMPRGHSMRCSPWTKPQRCRRPCTPAKN